jgi:hypothetical protein
MFPHIDPKKTHIRSHTEAVLKESKEPKIQPTSARKNIQKTNETFSLKQSLLTHVRCMLPEKKLLLFQIRKENGHYIRECQYLRTIEELNMTKELILKLQIMYGANENKTAIDNTHKTLSLLLLKCQFHIKNMKSIIYIEEHIPSIVSQVIKHSKLEKRKRSLSAPSQTRTTKQVTHFWKMGKKIYSILKTHIETYLKQKDIIDFVLFNAFDYGLLPFLTYAERHEVMVGFHMSSKQDQDIFSVLDESMNRMCYKEEIE